MLRVLREDQHLSKQFGNATHIQSGQWSGYRINEIDVNPLAIALAENGAGGDMHSIFIKIASDVDYFGFERYSAGNVRKHRATCAGR